MSAAHSSDAIKNLPQLLNDLDGTSSCMALLFNDVNKGTGTSCAGGELTRTMGTDPEMIVHAEAEVLEDEHAASGTCQHFRKLSIKFAS